MSDLSDYVSQSKDAIRALKEVKRSMGDDLSEIRVVVNSEDSPSVANAIDEVFGEMESDDPRKGYITFDMYMQCMRIINAAGQAKASSILDKDFS